eukprot:CAMPEP_0185748818 /NCGR_PEP_ID=MMETSP1174-20130828/7524_1 /TAXON_ID=35687 /ORGANISM="Dictyocha speculum, Strain CCMP1381" /LENGTH=60 /DNA_ID=CAMNT_0028424663 /DNA_START=107 /DNA_END=289 /DNA_ORIENTATION=-
MAITVHDPQVKLRFSMSLSSSFPEPLYRKSIILRYTMAITVHAPQAKLSNYIALSSRLLK